MAKMNWSKNKLNARIAEDLRAERFDEKITTIAQYTEEKALRKRSVRSNDLTKFNTDPEVTFLLKKCFNLIK